MERILVLPPFTLSKLMAAYYVWETDREAGGRALVSFQPATRRKPSSAAELLVDGAAVSQILHNGLATGNQRLKILINYCQTVQPPYAFGSFAHTLEALGRHLKPFDERLFLAFMQVANRVLTGEPQLLRRGSREVLAQDPFFRAKLYPPPPAIAGTELRQTEHYCVAVSNTLNDHLIGRFFDDTPAAAMISRDPHTGQAKVQLRVRPWRAPVDLKRLWQELPPEERWRLEQNENCLSCPATRLSIQELLQLFAQVSHPH